MNARRPGRDYADPHVAGVGLGLVLLASFVLTGRGLGAVGAFASVSTALVKVAAPAHLAASPVFSRYTDGFANEWIVFEIAGVMIGGFLSARFAGRAHLEIERGPRASISGRLVSAFAGGALMGAGAVLARGCTSGLALTGGALLSVGAWIFMLAAFAAGYAIAPWLRKAWR